MRVSVIDLVDSPGESRELAGPLAPGEVGSDAPWGLAENSLQGPFQLDLRLESLVDGIFVSGSVGYVLQLSCARCLTPVVQEREGSVGELYRDPARHPDDTEPGYEIGRDLTIDLETMLRDLVVLAVPVRVLCREDCQGLCPTCGADRNELDCGHATAGGPDPRWAPLLELELPQGQ